MQSSVEPTLLVMTATITPPAGALALNRVDPALRLQDYRQALEFYLSDRCRWVDRIAFVENSGSDLAPLEAMTKESKTRKDVEFLSFHGLDYPPEYGRGYGEFKLLDHALRHSRLLSGLPPSAKWWKVTGRLRVTNIDRLIRTAPAHYDYYADFRFHKRAVDVRLLSFSREGYERLFRDRYHDLANARIEDSFFERFASNHDARELRARGIVPEFWVVPRFEGIGGWGNTNYASMKHQLVYTMRSTARFLQNLRIDPLRATGLRGR